MIWKRLFGNQSKPAGPPAQPDQGDPMADWQPENPLEEAMGNVPQSADAAADFARLLLDSTVMLAVPPHDRPEGERELPQAEKFDIFLIDDGGGGATAAMFTSERRVAEAFGEGTRYIAMDGRAALTAVADIGVVINPGPVGLYLKYGPETIARILAL
ncbi:SseB family protein [Aurantiacibacter gilvus]|uniref:SseB family protein n=1 Tax=Aurantiacibacter gilvus TaxID=3139141 RepID=A0ABU9IDK7_9SPHN